MRIEGDRVLRRSAADVVGGLLLGRVDNHVLIPAARADDHATIHLDADLVKERASLHNVFVGVSRQLPRVLVYERTLSSRNDLALELLVSVEERTHNPHAARQGQIVAAEAYQA